MNSSSVMRILDDNRIIRVAPSDHGFAAWVKQDRWSAWQGGFHSSEEALAWAESIQREVDDDVCHVGVGV